MCVCVRVCVSFEIDIYCVGRANICCFMFASANGVSQCQPRKCMAVIPEKRILQTCIYETRKISRKRCCTRLACLCVFEDMQFIARWQNSVSGLKGVYEYSWGPIEKPYCNFDNFFLNVSASVNIYIYF